MENLLKPSAKSVLVPLGLWAGMSEADAAIQKKIYRSGPTALIISNKEMEDIIKMIKSIEESGLQMKGISERIENEAKKQNKTKQKGGLFSMLLGTLAASILRNALAGKGVIRAV